jgi:hypothetical protein
MPHIGLTAGKTMLPHAASWDDFCPPPASCRLSVGRVPALDRVAAAGKHNHTAPGRESS